MRIFQVGDRVKLIKHTALTKAAGLRLKSNYVVACADHRRSPYLVVTVHEQSPPIAFRLPVRCFLFLSNRPMVVNQFDAGDAVKLVSHGMIGWEKRMWTRLAKLRKNKVYFLTATVRGKYPAVVIVNAEGKAYNFHPNHFVFVPEVQA